MLGESVRKARLRKDLTQAGLARLASVSRRHLAALEKGANVSVSILQRVASALDLSEIQIGGLRAEFPRVAVRAVAGACEPRTGTLRDAVSCMPIETAGGIRHGAPLDVSAKERLTIPRPLVGDGELVFRVHGHALHADGMLDGDLLIVEPRPSGHAATGELVLGRIRENVFVGRWWQKHGLRSLLSNGGGEVTQSEALQVIGAVNQVLRVRESLSR